MVLKGALHTHTTCSDGELTIPEVVQVYLSLGFDFVAITDHDFLLRPLCYENQISLIQTDLIVFKGIELTLFEKGYLHITKIVADQEELHIFNHPSELNLPLSKVLERIEGVAKTVPIDLVEVTAKGFYTPEYDIPEIPYPKVATDDSHNLRGCGRAWVEMSCERDKQAIIRSLKKGEFWNCYHKS